MELDTIASTFSGSVAADTGVAARCLQPELPLEELVRRSKPAVVYLRSVEV